MTTPSTPPAALPLNPDGIAAALKDRPQWVCWDWEYRRRKEGGEGKWTKPPVSPVTGNKASSTDPSTWAPFAEALRFAHSRQLPGIGHAVTRDDPYVGIDLDKCRDSRTGDIELWAQEIIDRFNSYTEVSPSGTGVRIFIQTDTGVLPSGEDGRRKGPIEVYGAGRYFTLTGRRLNGTREIVDCTDELGAFCAELFGSATTREAAPIPGTTVHLTDEEVLHLARSAANGGKFQRLWTGETSDYGGDDSAADMALLGILSFYTQNPAQLDRLFRRSGLYRSKWERADYRERSIDRALMRGEVYEARGPLLIGGRIGTGSDPEDSTFLFTSSGKTVSGVSAWPERKPLPEVRPPVPTLPAWMVPEPLRPWLVDAADRVKVPLEMVAAPAIVGAGGVVGRRVGIRPGEYDEFTVVPNLWGAEIARPGWMKSESLKEAFRPIGRLIATAKRDHEQASLLMEGKAARIKAELKAVERRMAMAARGEPPKEGQSVESLETLEAAFAHKSRDLGEAVTTERRYHTQDPTVEKLGELLCENPRGMLLLRDELSGWLLTLGKPGREGDREFYLEAWNGTGSYTVDRIGRGTLHIPSLTLSVFGGIQPGKLKHLLDGAVEGGMGDDGMMQRLQMAVWPDCLPEWTKPTGWGDSDAKASADAIYAWLDVMDSAQVGAQDADIPFLRYSPDAQQVADRWRDGLERRLRSGELDETPAFASHIAKYRSLMPALALVFYLIDLAAKTPGVTKGAVSEAHARLAADWGGFLEAHARKVYAAETQSNFAAAHALATKVTSGAVFDGQPVRELYRPQWANLRTSEQVWAGLIKLADLGWLRVESRFTGGNPSQVVRLHPDLIDTKGADATGSEPDE